MRGDDLTVRTWARQTTFLKLGGVSTKKYRQERGDSMKSIDKKVRIVFWIGFWSAMAICLAAWIFTYMHQVFHWSGSLDSDYIVALLASTATAAVYLLIYLYIRKQGKH